MTLIKTSILSAISTVIKVIAGFVSIKIVANRLSEDLVDVKERVYTRDIFGGDS